MDPDESKRRGAGEAGNGGNRADAPTSNLQTFNLAVPDTERPAQNARFIVCVLGTAVLALALHMTLGWEWTVIAGMVGGAMHPRRGGLVGLLGVGLDWMVLVGYNYAVAGAAMETMTRTVGGILGNTPEVLVVAATVFIGALLGGLGGAIGALARGAA